MSRNSPTLAPMTPIAFIKKWKMATLTERQAAQEHFIDLCSLLGHPTPSADDPNGICFAFEKGASKVGGGKGFADVWKKDHFAWEYKRKKGNLDDALHQLIRYAPALESPPLQVVCDIERFRIHTAWTNTVPATYEIKLDDLVDVGQREILRNVFHDPEKLKPAKTRAAVTTEAADKFSAIAARLKDRGTPEDIAHFVNQLVFCFFANSVKLLEDGLFPKLLQRASQRPERAQRYLNDLFAAMEIGGEYDLNDIAHFNGGLFDGRRALPLDKGDIDLLAAAGSLDWSLIDPSIFGTLFERFLDPDKRAQIGAHYTDQEKIAKLIEPVILRPLREEWEVAKTEIESLLAGRTRPPMLAKKRRRMTRQEAAEEVRSRYLERLCKLHILDPACGSGNFLYLALQGVKDLENKANLECEILGLASRLPFVGPEILHGIEINPLAAELARTTIWIGDIQWRLRNGIHAKPRPILRKLDSIECRNAVLADAPCFLDGPTATAAREAEWPEAEFIVGNPPFLGVRLLRAGLGDQTVEQLFDTYDGRVSREADLVCYWFEKARAALKAGRARRVGLVATNSIRGGANRKVLDRIVAETRIFEAWSDEEWTVDGAAVRVSLVAFAKDYTGAIRLDGKVVPEIHANLRGETANLTVALRLRENAERCFQGPVKVGPFDVAGAIARQWLELPSNANGLPNAAVLKPLVNASDITRRTSDRWIVDFGEATEEAAAFYAEPFGHVVREVKPLREKNRRGRRAEKWWQHGETVPGLKAALAPLSRYIATPRVAKHRVFVWLSSKVLPDSAVVAIASDQDAVFGVLQSRFHEKWSLRVGSSLEDRPRYTPSSTFDTFPFPNGVAPNISAKELAQNHRAQAIAKAARELADARDRWLNPEELVAWEPEIVEGFPSRPTAKSPAAANALKKRTLTALYNKRGTPEGAWLDALHRTLDAAVAEAYGWEANISEEEALAKLLDLNLSRAAASESMAAVTPVRKRSRAITPEELRRSPQFKFPIKGGKQSGDDAPAKVKSASPSKQLKGHSQSRRWVA